MAAAWQNCLINSSDVKELTPEFFYLPNFLVNADDFQLGQRQVRLASMTAVYAAEPLVCCAQSDHALELSA